MRQLAGLAGGEEGVGEVALPPRILNMTVPQVGHLPLMALRPFFMVSSTASEISFLALHLTQYPSGIREFCLRGLNGPVRNGRYLTGGLLKASTGKAGPCHRSLQIKRLCKIGRSAPGAVSGRIEPPGSKEMSLLREPVGDPVRHHIQIPVPPEITELLPLGVSEARACCAVLESTLDPYGTSGLRFPP